MFIKLARGLQPMDMDFSQDHDSVGFLWVSSSFSCCDDGDKNGMIPGCQVRRVP
jgi:hypothetical protein